MASLEADRGPVGKVARGRDGGKYLWSNAPERTCVLANHH
jgi:hypothetical protein